jgi:hypothetical protein
MLAYAKQALNAVVYLFKPFNDIDIYVEDKTDLDTYVILLNRMLSPSASLRRLFPLGGRQQVLEACRQDANTNRPALYIIDSDFDLIHGRPAPALPKFHRLNAYCYENLLLSSEALTEFAFQQRPTQTKTDLHAAIGYTTFIKSTVRLLARLFALYAVSEELRAGIPTVSRHVFTLCTRVNHAHVLDPQKLKHACRQLHNDLLLQYGPATIHSLFRQFRRRLSGPPDQVALLISGKAYLIPLIVSHLQLRLQMPLSVAALKTALAHLAPTDTDPDLRKALRSAARIP